MIRYMKTWFFSGKDWQDRKGRWRTGIYAMVAMGGHITYGSSIWEAFFMAHDLIACVKDCPPDESYKPIWLTDYSENKYWDTSYGTYIGTIDIDIDLVNNGWIRRGDLAPATRQYTRYRMYKKAFKMIYNFNRDNNLLNA